MLTSHGTWPSQLLLSELEMKNIILVVTLFILSACGGGGGGGGTPPNVVTRSITISWDANNESSVNQSGGGYRVYYSTTSGFNITDAGVIMVDVPYAAGPVTSVTIDLDSGTYYFKVVAYGNYSPVITPTPTSTPSAQLIVNVPYG